MDIKDRLEPVRACDVKLTHRVSLVARFLPVTNHRGSRIVVCRADGGRDPMRLIVSWDHHLTSMRITPRRLGNMSAARIGAGRGLLVQQVTAM